MKIKNSFKLKTVMVITGLVLSVAVLGGAAPVYAGTTCGAQDSVHTTIDLGCSGKIQNPIMDMTFGIIRFLSMGVGLVVVGSIVVAGIQYAAAHGVPAESAKAQKRISSSLMALLIYIFAYAILNYLIPKGFLQ